MHSHFNDLQLNTTQIYRTIALEITIVVVMLCRKRINVVRRIFYFGQGNWRFQNPT